MKCSLHARRATDLVTDDEIEAALAEATPVAPECQRCSGTGRLEVYEHSGYGRRLGTVECDGPNCHGRGQLDEVECENCMRVVAIPSEDAHAHFCRLDADTAWYLCPECRRDAGLHLSGCRS